MDTKTIQTLSSSKTDTIIVSTIGRSCIICEESFSLWSSRDERMICPECLKRLKKLLYPEEE